MQSGGAAGIRASLWVETRGTSQLHGGGAHVSAIQAGALAVSFFLHSQLIPLPVLGCRVNPT